MQTRHHIDRSDMPGCCKALVGRGAKVRVSLGSKRQSQRGGGRTGGPKPPASPGQSMLGSMPFTAFGGQRGERVKCGFLGG